MIQRRVIAGLALAASTTMLAACGFDSPAVTNTEHSSIQGTSFATGSIDIRAAFVSAVSSGAATAGSPLAVVVTFVNNGKADRLISASSPLGPVSLVGPGTQSGSLALPAGVPVQIVDPSLDTSGPAMTIAATKAAPVGTFVRVSFTFANAGKSATVQVPVLPRGETEQVTTRITGAPATPPVVTGDTSQ